jgi:hypothetical protein
MAATAELGDHVLTPADSHVVKPGPSEPSPQHGLGHQHIPGVGGRDEDDVGRGGHRHRPEAVAGAGERGVRQGEDQAAVSDGVPVHHVVAHRHAGHRPPVALIDQLDAQATGRLVLRHHRLDGRLMLHSQRLLDY